MNGEIYTEKNEADTTSSVIDHQQGEASFLIVGPEKKPEPPSPKLDSSCSSNVVSEKAVSAAPSSTIIITNDEYQQQQQLASCLKEHPEEKKAKFSEEPDRHSDNRGQDKMDQNANKVLQQDQQHFEKRVQGTITTPDEGIDIDNFISQPALADSSSTNNNLNGFASTIDHPRHVAHHDLDFLSESPLTASHVVHNLLLSENFEDQPKEQNQLEEELFVEEPPIRLNSSSSIDIIKDDESEDLESRQNFNLQNNCSIIQGVFENSIIIDRHSPSSSELPLPPPTTMEGMTFDSQETENMNLGLANPFVQSPIGTADFPNTVIEGVFDDRLILSTYYQDSGEPAKTPSSDQIDGCLMDQVGGEEIYTCRIMTPETDLGSESDVISKPESPVPTSKPESPLPTFESQNPIHLPEHPSSVAAAQFESPALISEAECPVSPTMPESPILEMGSPIPKMENPVMKSQSPVPNLRSPVPKSKSPSPVRESPSHILQQQTSNIESPTPSAPLLSDEVIYQDDVKIYGDDIDHVSRAYDESQKALFDQTHVENVAFAPTADISDHFVSDAYHDRETSSAIETTHGNVEVGIAPPLDEPVESPMTSPTKDHQLKATVSPMMSKIEMDIVDDPGITEHKFPEDDHHPSHQLAKDAEINHHVDLSLHDHPSHISDMRVDHFSHEEPKLACELTACSWQAEVTQSTASNEVTVPAMNEKFLIQELVEPEPTKKLMQEEAMTGIEEPRVCKPPEPEVPQKLHDTFKHVEAVGVEAPTFISEPSKEELTPHTTEAVSIESVEKQSTPEPVRGPSEEMLKVEETKPLTEAPEIPSSKSKSTPTPKHLTAAKIEEKKKPDSKALLDKIKKAPGVSPAAQKASPAPKQTTATPKAAVATKAATRPVKPTLESKPVKATPESKPVKAAPESKPTTPKATPTKPTTPKTPVASLSRRTQSHSPARPAPPPAVPAVQSRRDSKPKASEIFAERKKKREEEHLNKKKITTVAAPATTSVDDKVQQEKEHRRKEAEAAFQSWLQRKDQERKRARSTGRPVDSSHSKDAKSAANKRRDDAQAAFQSWLSRKSEEKKHIQLKQKPDAKEDHV